MYSLALDRQAPLRISFDKESCERASVNRISTSPPLPASPCFQFLPDDRVIVEPLKIPGETLANLEDNLRLFFAGNSRNASDILRDRDSRTKQNNTENAGKSSLHQTIGAESRDALLGVDLNGFADLMNTPWEHKKKRSPGGESRHDRAEEPSKSNYLLSRILTGL